MAGQRGRLEWKCNGELTLFSQHFGAEAMADRWRNFRLGWLLGADSGSHCGPDWQYASMGGEVWHDYAILFLRSAAYRERALARSVDACLARAARSLLLRCPAKNDEMPLDS